MSSAPLTRIIGLAVVFAAGACSGKDVRLGDGPELGAGNNCPHARVLASEVLWIGDSWVNIPGIQHTRVRDLARAEGAIGSNDDYVDLAASATTLAMIAGQYAMQEASSTKVKVLIFDGGTWDTIVSSGSDASVQSVLAAFPQFLTQVASDGTVEHIIYYLPPELSTIPGVAALRPGLEQTCAASTVPCHFLDLQPLWTGHPEYTAQNAIQASTAGGTVIADSIWAIMQRNCIAQ